jgi:hypothetical protein
VEVTPMMEVRPVECMTMYEAGSATMEDGRRPETATVDRHSTTSEATAMKGCAATTEATAMECGSATAETTAVETAATAAETTAMETTASAAETTTAHPTAVLNLGRQSVGEIFR